MQVIPSLLIQSLAAGAATLIATTSFAADPRITNFPLAIICEYEGNALVSYLDKVSEDGVATYLGLNTNRAQRIDGPEGTVQPLAGSLPLSCFGKTVEELRSEGSVIEMAR